MNGMNRRTFIDLSSSAIAGAVFIDLRPTRVHAVEPATMSLLAVAAFWVAKGMLEEAGAQAFDQLRQEVFGRERSLSWHLRETAHQVDRMLKLRLQEQDLREAESLLSATERLLAQYSRSPSARDRLEHATRDSQLCCVQLEKLGLVAYPAFMSAAGCHLMCLQERAKTTPGEGANYWDSLGLFSTHHKRMMRSWRWKIDELFRPVVASSHNVASSGKFVTSASWGPKNVRRVYEVACDLGATHLPKPRVLNGQWKFGDERFDGGSIQKGGASKHLRRQLHAEARTLRDEHIRLVIGDVLEEQVLTPFDEVVDMWKKAKPA